MLLREEINCIYDPIRNRYKGVYPSLDRWQAIIQSQGLCKYLGRFETQQLAAEVVVTWYKDNYGPLWKGVISRNDWGKAKRIPWEISRHIVKDGLGSFTGWMATVWVNSKPVKIVPNILEMICDIDTFNSGYWTEESYASYACEEFLSRFKHRKIERHILFRIE